TSLPYNTPWDTTQTADGSHTLSAVARDAAGNTANAANVSITVSDAVAPPSGTKLYAAAAQTAPGTWLTFPTDDLLERMKEKGAGREIMGYATVGQWDPTGHSAFFIGGDHDEVERMVRYDETTNAWSRMPNPPDVKKVFTSAPVKAGATTIPTTTS